MIRPAEPADMEAVYRMGYDAWGEGAPLSEYLKACAESRKYRSGEWFVLADGGRPVSSLLLHRLEGGTFGLGSIATAPEERRRGRAAELVAGVLERLDAAGATEIYLHSDIAPGYYERLGFRALPSALQRREGTVCMVRCTATRIDEIRRDPSHRPPSYF